MSLFATRTKRWFAERTTTSHPCKTIDFCTDIGVFRDIGSKVGTPNESKRYYLPVCSSEERRVLQLLHVYTRAKSAEVILEKPS